jgi:hypothetical protein
MLRRLSAAFIVLYLAALGYGLLAHTLGFRAYQHMGMYFVVWDMYGGWSAWETRTHLLGEGESGLYYELAPGPWGAVRPFGDTERQHYDGTGIHLLQLARNTVDHTDHEPIVRYLVIEEAWSKKYNLPETLWRQRFDEPREPHSYFRIRSVHDGAGRLLVGNHPWLQWLATQSLASNPRLQADLARSTPFITSDAFTRSANVIVPVGYESYAPPPEHTK